MENCFIMGNEKWSLVAKPKYFSFLLMKDKKHHISWLWRATQVKFRHKLCFQERVILVMSDVCYTLPWQRPRPKHLFSAFSVFRCLLAYITPLWTIFSIIFYQLCLKCPYSKKKGKLKILYDHYQPDDLKTILKWEI